MNRFMYVTVALCLLTASTGVWAGALINDDFQAGTGNRDLSKNMSRVDIGGGQYVFSDAADPNNAYSVNRTALPAGIQIDLDLKMTAKAVPNAFKIFFHSIPNGTADPRSLKGYWLSYVDDYNTANDGLQLWRKAAYQGAETKIGQANVTVDLNVHHLRIIDDGTGVINVYWDNSPSPAISVNDSASYVGANNTYLSIWAFSSTNGWIDNVTVSGDDPPAAVTDLVAGNPDWFKLDLTFTAPTDFPLGPVASYDIRYSTSPITDANWASANSCGCVAVPATPGTVQTVLVQNLQANTTYYFAMRSADAGGKISEPSNVASGTTSPFDVMVPTAVSDLASSNVRANRVTLSWTSTGDDGQIGQARQYDVRYSSGPLDEVGWAGATPVTAAPSPKVAGSAETFTMAGLAPQTTYYVALKVGDEVPNWSGISNVAMFTTPAADLVPPATITDVRSPAMQIHSAWVTWTAPSDSGGSGIGCYDVRYSTSAITDAAWASATPAAGLSTPSAPGTIEHVTIDGLNPDTVYYFAVRTSDQAEPPNVSAISNVVSGRTRPVMQPVTVHNPWLVNDRVADTRTLASMAATFGNAYTPDGVIPGTTDQVRAINEYNNFKRREYHWHDDPPNRGDVVENINVFGHSLCGGHAMQNSTILDAMGLHARTGSVDSGAHTLHEVWWDNAWHLMDTMTTMYVFTRSSSPTIASAAQIQADKTLMTSAVAEGRACPGFLLCPDDVVWFANGTNSWSIINDPGSFAPVFSMNMDLHFGEVLHRTWESWANQYPAGTVDSDSIPGNDPPYHHDAVHDWKDTVSFPYWEPYTLNATQDAALNIGHPVTYRRWANGTYDLRPDFGTAGYQAMLVSSSNIATRNDDGKTPDLHPAATGTPASVVFHVQLPFYITDCNISGTFTRNGTSDINKIYYGTTSSPTTLVWNSTAAGTTQLNNLNLRTNVFGRFDFYIKVEVQASAQITDAGVGGLLISTTYEHSKGAMAYLDKGVNHITVTFDNPAELAASGAAFKVTYKWKEFDGTDWTIDKVNEQYIPTSPFTYTIASGGTKVPRTEYIQMEVCEPPPPCDLVPASIMDLVATDHDCASVTLGWTAVLDPCSHGAAAAYDLRYSTSPITADNFDGATAAANPPAPGAPETSESFALNGLQADTTYFFALKVKSFGGNWSEVSAVATARTDLAAVTPPAWVKDLVAQTSKTGGGIDLIWTATGGDACGQAVSYDLRYSTSPILYNDGDVTWNAATGVTGLPIPKAPGSAESFTVTGLTGGTFCYFALKVTDKAGNVSEVSNTTYAFASTIGEKVLQNGLGGYNGCRDNYVESSSPTAKYGAYERMRIACYADQGDTERGFIRFDLSSIPAGTTVRSARLKLYSYNISKMQGSAGFYGLYPLTRAFDETTSNYNYADATTPWTTPGGDFVGTPDATAPKNPVKVAQWYNWDLTSRVQDWIDTPAGNLGWCVRGTVETTHCQDEFYQSDSQQAAYRPMLVVSDLPAPIIADISGDGGVDVVDLLFFVDSFGWILGERGYDPKCDLNGDGGVDVVDLLIFVENFGK